LNEAFGFSVGLWGIGFGEDLTEAEPFAGGAEQPRPIAGAVVGHHPLDADAKLRKISNGSLQEGDCTLLALVDHDLDEGDTRSVVDADVDELPTDAVMAVDRARISTGNAMAHGADPAKLSDIQMDESRS
jgi:hypothetical protein